MCNQRRVVSSVPKHVHLKGRPSLKGTKLFLASFDILIKACVNQEGAVVAVHTKQMEIYQTDGDVPNCSGPCCVYITNISPPCLDSVPKAGITPLPPLAFNMSMHQPFAHSARSGCNQHQQLEPTTLSVQEVTG